MKSLQLPKPHLLVIVGVPASGKTTFATKFSETFGAPFIDATMFGYTASQNLEMALTVLKEVMKTKTTILLEGTSGTRRDRQMIARFAHTMQYEVLFVWVQTDESMAHQRATKRTRTNTAPRTTEEFDKGLAAFSPLHATEKPVVISGMHTYASQAKVVLKRLTGDAGRTSPDLRPIERTSTPSQSGRIVIR
jgi:predicted kinase